MAPTYAKGNNRKQAKSFLVVSLIATVVLLWAGGRNSKAQDYSPKRVDVASAPINQRRSAFTAASPQEKSEAFRTRLALYLARHPGLNQTQQQTLLMGISVAVPELYETPTENPEWKAKFQGQLKEFQSRVLASFSRDDAGAIFASMANLDGQDDSLRNYRETIALSMAERRRVFLAASAKDKSDLWRTHLALYIAKHSELADAQKIIILEGMSLATPEFFAVPFGGADWKDKVGAPIKAFQNHILGVFSKPNAGKVFATLGDPQFPGEPAIARFASPLSTEPARDDSRSMFVLARFDAPAMPDCECNKDESFCGVNYVCGNGQCQYTQYGCGYFWLNQCNGNCNDRNED